MNDSFLRKLGDEWRKTPGTPFAKFILDAFTGNGVLALYEMTDAQILRHLKAYYKQHSNRSNPLKGGK